jgi:hypothetical protein
MLKKRPPESLLHGSHMKNNKEKKSRTLAVVAPIGPWIPGGSWGGIRRVQYLSSAWITQRWSCTIEAKYDV